MVNKLSSRFGSNVVVLLLLSALLSTSLVHSSSFAQVTEYTTSKIKNTNILHKESADDDDRAVWLLNAGIEVATNAILYINSTDTSWLKIAAADGQTAHLIHILQHLSLA
jgi:hypothetical protein